MAIPLNLYDQMVYDAGYKFIPQSQYLLNPFQIPTEPTSNVGGLPSQVTPIIPRVISQPQGDGDGGNRMGPASPRNISLRNTGNELFAKSKARANNTGGITNADVYQDKIMGGVPGDPNPFGYQNQINDFVIDNEPYKEIAGFNFIDAPTSLISRIQNPQFIDNPRTGFIDNTIMKKGNPQATSIIGNAIKKGKTGIETIAQFLPFGEKSITGAALRGIGSLLPERDYRQNVLEDFYDDEDTQDLMSQIPGMSDYNVISGFGANANYGLSRAIDSRIATIKNTLKKKNSAVLEQRLKDLQALKEKEAEKLETARQQSIEKLNKQKADAKAAGDAKKARDLQIKAAAQAQEISRREATRQQEAIERDQQRDSNRGGSGSGEGGYGASGPGSGGGYNEGNRCFEPNTFIQMTDGSTKKIKDIQLGDDTKGGEVTGVFQFKASDEIHDYKGVTVAGSHYVKEDGRFIMVKDSPLAVKIDKIPVVYSLDTTGRRIFINDIEFADYNGDGIAKGFLSNAGVDLTGFDKEVLRQVENRLI